MFQVGEEVFLKLQPYIQTSVSRRSNHKLAFKFFGPFVVLERIGAVAYSPPASHIHPIFHVSQLKKCLRQNQQVISKFPPANHLFQFPVNVLQKRVRQNGLATVVQGLIQWCGTSPDMATWEDWEALKQQFPLALAWGQVGIQAEGIVNDQDPCYSSTVPLPTTEPRTEEKLDQGKSQADVGRPRRTIKPPTWLAGHEWAR